MIFFIERSVFSQSLIAFLFSDFLFWHKTGFNGVWAEPKACFRAKGYSPWKQKEKSRFFIYFSCLKRKK